LRSLQKQMADAGFGLLPKEQQAKLKQQASDASAEIEQLTGGGKAGGGTGSAETGGVKRFKYNAESGKLEPVQTTGSPAVPAHTEDEDLVEQ
jgi:hypothetical protein